MAAQNVPRRYCNGYNRGKSQELPSSAGAAQGAKVFAGRFIPAPLRDIVGLFNELALLTRFESRNTTITVISSWKCRRTPRSTFFKSEYRISLFFAASCKAVFTSLRAIPCIKKSHNFILLHFSISSLILPWLRSIKLGVNMLSILQITYAWMSSQHPILSKFSFIAKVTPNDHNMDQSTECYSKNKHMVSMRKKTNIGALKCYMLSKRKEL